MAEDYIEAMSNCSNTIGELSDEWDASTCRDLLLGAIGSQQAVTNTFTIPRLPDTLMEESSGKQTRSANWYRANFPKTLVKSIKESH